MPKRFLSLHQKNQLILLKNRSRAFATCIFIKAACFLLVFGFSFLYSFFGSSASFLAELVMPPKLEQNYIGLSETSSMERGSEKFSSSSPSSSTFCSEDEKNNNWNLKETELRLGLPGSESPERKIGNGMSLLGKDLADKTNGFSLMSPMKSSVSGTKRGFAEAINGSDKWGFTMNGGSDVDFGKDDGMLSARGGTSVKAVDCPPAPEPVEGNSAFPEKEHRNAPASKAQVVGWPPIRSFRRNNFPTILSKSNDAHGKLGPSCLFVKISMDGAPYLRKVDLKTYFNYAELSSALEKMFSDFTSGQCTSDGLHEQERLNVKGSLMDLLKSSEYVLTYVDKDGDLMLVGDVPWEMFINSCKRLRIMRGSEAIGIASRAVQKFKNQN